MTTTEDNKRVLKVAPLSQRAKNRAKEHNLSVVKLGHFQGKEAVLMRCTNRHDPECNWTGWFTLMEMQWRWEDASDGT